MVPRLNQRGHPVEASVCFGGVAIHFVSSYAVIFRVESVNATFLPMLALLQMRVGIHTQVGRVNISESPDVLVKDVGEATEGTEPVRVSFVPRGKLHAKGKGDMEMYFVARV